jgi:antitoxin MazE
MIGKIEQWKGGLGVRIPQSVTDQARFRAGTTVTISFENGRLIVAPEAPIVFSLEELLAGITSENIHGETNWGPAVGNELW